MHEVFHNLSALAWYLRVPSTVNEAVTEYLTRRQGVFPPDDVVMGKAYEGSQRLISDYVAANPAREAALAKAFLAGDFRDLERLEDAPVRRPYGPRFVASPNPLDVRFRSWDALLTNRLPGSSVAIDDESILGANRPVAPTAVEDRRGGY